MKLSKCEKIPTDLKRIDNCVQEPAVPNDLNGSQRFNMSSMIECESRLRTLQQYIPFLERMIERLATSEDDSTISQRAGMKSLLDVISNSGKQ